MDHPDRRICEFIRKHFVLTIAVTRNDRPYCATCFYAWMKDQDMFIITSDHDTRHIRDVVEGDNYYVAGAIALETRIVGKIRGVQFTGTLKALEGEEYGTARTAYLKRFPVARLMPALHLWSLTPDFIKFTDNRFGFGKKLIWRPGDATKSGPDAA